MAAGLAGTLATWAGGLFGFGHNYWAMVAAVVPLGGRSTRHRVRRGIQRIIGTGLGLLVLVAILLVVPAAPAILLRDRIVETVIGAAVGIAVVLAPGAWHRFRQRTTAP